MGEGPSLDGTPVVLRRWELDVATRGATGAIEAISLWAG